MVRYVSGVSLGDAVRGVEDRMTANRNLKRRVRARAAKTGESYTAALRHFRQTPTGEDDMPENQPGAGRLRVAVAQTIVRDDPRDAAALRAAGREVRELMRAARRAGARLVHFPEGAMCAPDKRLMSAGGPDRVGPADWDGVEWEVLREELNAVAALAGELGLWTVLGSVHRLTAPNRPHNSLYVIDDCGEVVTRYDERMLSNTKVLFMYAPGVQPVMFDVDDVRFGCLLGIEVHFPELFAEYERQDVDCVLLSTTGGSPGDFATQARGHAAGFSYWVSFSVPAQHSETAPAGIISPAGQWLARCPAAATPSIAVVDLDRSAPNVEEAVSKARPWRRKVRSGLHAPHVVTDPRSEARTAF